MDYKGYKIEHDGNHYKVIDPDGIDWSEDTIEDAKAAIDTELEPQE